jgi:hypothetical protein
VLEQSASGTQCVSWWLGSVPSGGRPNLGHLILLETYNIVDEFRHGLAVDAEDDSIWVIHWLHHITPHVIKKYSTDGTLKKSFPVPDNYHSLDQEKGYPLYWGIGVDIVRKWEVDLCAVNMNNGETLARLQTDMPDVPNGGVFHPSHQTLFL